MKRYFEEEKRRNDCFDCQKHFDVLKYNYHIKEEFTMKKRILCVVSTAILVLSLAACGGKEAKETKETKDEKASESIEETEEKDEKDEKDAKDAQEKEKEKKKEEAKKKEQAEQPGEFEEITVVDDENCCIKITGIDLEGEYGPELKAYIENKSEDKTYTVSIEHATINGIQADGYIYMGAEVAAQKKANETIEISEWDLEKYGIDKLTDIQLQFNVFDSDSWEDVVSASAHVYPYGEENAETYVREAKETDKVLVDNEYVKVTAIDAKMNEEYDWYEVNLYVENKTDAEVMFAAENASINGYMIEPYWAVSVIPKTVGFSTMSWYSDELEENDISEVEEIEFELNAYDYDSYDSYAEETVVINP